jgi:GntR family transcriptional regulator of abcA and norABC
MGSISKSLAPGLRLGWLAGPESIVERLGDVKMQTDYGASSLSQWALTEWMESGLYEQHLLTLRKSLKERRDLVLRTLNSHFKDIATWNVPTGGYYIWLKLNKNISTDRLFDSALKEKLLINPGSIYDFSQNQHIRISYSYAEPDELVKGLIKLSELVEKMY